MFVELNFPAENKNKNFLIIIFDLPFSEFF